MAFLENENPALLSDVGELKGGSKREIQEGKSRQAAGEKKSGIALGEFTAFFKQFVSERETHD